VITRLVLLGATGDLAGRFLLPALARAVAAGQLPDDLQVVAAAPQDGDDETFRASVATRLQQHAGDVPAQARQALLDALRYRRLDLSDPGSVAAAVHGSSRGATDTTPVALYLALPPALFPAAIGALGAAAPPPGSRIAVEKPFGEDLAGAVALNALLARVVGGADDAVFRVDHALGMPRVRSLPLLRAAGGVLEPVWDATHLARVEVLWEETLGLEGRADFYDRTGAVRDVVQNHVLQVLALLAMEQPPDERELHAAKSAVLRSVRALPPAEVAVRTRRGRYTAGTLAGGVAVPDYAEEPGVDPARGTETFAELVLELDTPRWAGTRFVLRAGKALAVDRKGVRLHFRGAAPACHHPDVQRVSADQLWIDLDGPPRGGPAGVPGESAAYGQVLTDLLGGGSRTSVSGEEAEQAWRIVEPVLAAWSDGAVPLLEYAAGSPGPT
jgi:glucose-6-phosphate 1-dehydrogenase